MRGQRGTPKQCEHMGTGYMLWLRPFQRPLSLKCKRAFL